MSKKVKQILSVMLAVFVFTGVVTTPVLATESEIIEEPVIEEEPAVESEETIQEETAEPTEAITEVIEETASEETASEEAATIIPADKDAAVIEGEMVLDPIDLTKDVIKDLEPVYEIMAEGDEGDGSGDVSINAGKTVTDTDGDGIYELALSVNATSDKSSSAQVTKSNIVLVIDVSGSMTQNSTWAVYEYDSLSYNANNVYRSGNSNQSARVYYNVAGGYWYYANGTRYNGTVYIYETRLASTKRAAYSVVDTLLAYNQNADNINDIFEITVVKFANRTATGNYNGTQMVIRDSTDATAIKTAINNLTGGGGTNWQAALEVGKTEADYFKNEDASEKTSVIFLTDGFPSYYGNDQGNGSDSNQNAANVQTSYNNARAAARAVVSAGYTLYNIFAFGSDTTTRNNHTGFQYLQALANWAYGSGNTDNYNATDTTRQYCFNARSTSELMDAFKTIIDHISNNVGYAGVNLSDGVSLGATSTSVAVNGTAKAETMRYSVTDDKGKLAYTVKFNSSGAATFTIYNADGTTQTVTVNTHEDITTTINDTVIVSQVYTATVGEGENAVSYKMSPATIDADTGMVKWDLAGLGILESGYTYTVAFDVWPNQLGYDIAADLNNGIYNSVEAALDAYNVTDADTRKHIIEALVHNADGSYSIYTNYEQSVDYYPATSQTDDEGNVTWTYGEKQTQNLPPPDPIPLKGSLLPMVKEWESGLAESELNELLWKDGVVGGTSNEYQITLYVWKADTEEELETKVNTGVTAENQPYITEVLGWDAEHNDYIWSRDAAVAPGTMVNLAEAEELGFDITDTSKLRTFTNDEGTVMTYYVIENGHYYYVTEEGADLHFELDTVIYHPMIVDGVLYNIFFGEGQTVEKMDPMTSVTATNTLKGGLNIHKIVSTTQIAVNDGVLSNVTEPVDEDGIETVTDEFTFEVKIWKVDDDGNKSAVYTYDDQIADGQTISGSIGYRVFSEPSLNTETGEIVYGSSLRGAVLTEDSPYASLANGIFATIENNETTILLTMPANGEIRLVNLPAGTQYTVREIVDPAAAYTYAATESSVINSSDENSEPVITTQNTVTGSISGNTASVETYYNWASNFYVYHSSDATIEKISFADTRVKGTFDAESGTYKYEFNIVDEVKGENANVSDFLYGGYYKAYAGTKLTDAQIRALTYTKKDDGTSWADNSASDDEYTYAYIKSSNMNAWKYDDGYDVSGLKMNPVSDGVYYLKEVPNGYIRPYLHYTYGTATKIVQAMWLISDLDDCNYTETGFIIDDGSTTAKVVASLTVKTANGGSTVKLTPEQVFRAKGVQKGYLTYIAASKYLVAGKTYTTKQYWKTKDGLTVEGVTTRTISIGTKKITGDNKFAATDADGLSIVK